MSIVQQDFAWLWQGIVKKKLTRGELHYLEPIEIHRGKTEHALLLIHGFSSSPAVFRTMFPALDDYDGVVIPVLPGHGQNIQAFSETSPQAWIDCVETECNKLLQRYKKVDVLGISLGGMLAYHLAQTYPLHHVFLLAPALALHFPMSLGPMIPKLLQKVGLASIKNQGGNIQDPKYAELTYRRLPIQAIIHILDMIHSFSFAPPTCPTDVFLGKHDAVVNSSKVIQLFQSQPHTHIHMLKHSAHVLSLDADVDQICAVIQRHLLKQTESTHNQITSLNQATSS